MATETVQVRLRHGTTEMTCWVDKPVKVGDLLVLKDKEYPQLLWKVMEVYGGTPPERGWKVGGL
jgi:hypothetical protein